MLQAQILLGTFCSSAQCFTKLGGGFSWGLGFGFALVAVAASGHHVRWVRYIAH
jgi:hypothetical protein